MRLQDLPIILAAVRRLPGVALLLTGAAVAVYALPTLTLALQFDPVAVESGQWWRLITGHWTHWSADHLWWDALVFLCLSIICERGGRLRYLTCVFASAMCISLVLCWTQSSAMIYRGLSGIDAALYVLLLGMIVRQQITARQWTWIPVAALFFLGFVAKICYEITTNSTVFVDSSTSGFVPLPLAHAIGAAVGLLTLFLGNNSKAERPRHLRSDSAEPHVLAAGVCGNVVEASSNSHSGQTSRPSARDCRRSYAQAGHWNSVMRS
jgi:rhomboid family GlyGly-CTERM serine protease